MGTLMLLVSLLAHCFVLLYASLHTLLCTLLLVTQRPFLSVLSLLSCSLSCIIAFNHLLSDPHPFGLDLLFQSSIHSTTTG